MREYFAGGGLEEVVRSVRELSAPHFHHEVVFRVIQWAVDHAPSPAAEAATVALLQHLRSTQAAGEGPLISPGQIVEGFRRAQERLADSVIDTPGAAAALDRLSAAAIEVGMLPPQVKQIK